MKILLQNVQAVHYNCDVIECFVIFETFNFIFIIIRTLSFGNGWNTKLK